MVPALVTVIIPVFNRFAEAHRAVRSVLDQTWSNWELIIVDDASCNIYQLPDETQAYKQNISLIRNASNIGPGLSRQRGLEKAKGQYVCFLDSDDYYHPEFIKYSLEVHKKYPYIAATYTAAQYIQTGQIREGSNKSYSYIMPTLFEQRRPWPTCSLLWKTEYTATWKPLRTNQDSLFELDCCFKNNSIAHVPEVLAFIDKGTGQNSADLVKNWMSDLNRNAVGIHALKNISKIIVKDSDRKRLKKAILHRIIYVSSKLAGNGQATAILNNGLSLIKAWRIEGLILVLLSFLVLIPIPHLRDLVKKSLTYLTK